MRRWSNRSIVGGRVIGPIGDLTGRQVPAPKARIGHRPNTQRRDRPVGPKLNTRESTTHVRHWACVGNRDALLRGREGPHKVSRKAGPKPGPGGIDLEARRTRRVASRDPPLKRAGFALSPCGAALANISSGQFCQSRSGRPFFCGPPIYVFPCGLSSLAEGEPLVSQCAIGSCKRACPSKIRVSTAPPSGALDTRSKKKLGN